MKHMTFHGFFLALVVSLVVLGPVSLAQHSHLGGDQVVQERNVISEPIADDDICDDDELGDGPTLSCEITKVTTDLDAAVPAAIFWGTFCENPAVLAGQEDGTFAPVLVLSVGQGFVTVDLTGNDDPADVVFTIECPCETCECKLTLGAVGPVGPTGPAGPGGGLTIIEVQGETVTVPAVSEGSATATCPPGTIAVSGGWIAAHPSNSFPGPSAMVSKRISEVTWEVRVKTPGQDVQLTVFVYCAS